MTDTTLSSRQAGAGVLATFTLTTFLSAILLFSVQPMFAKMVLPLLGGSPSVWAVALCFFQGALLAGYCYAHVLIAKVPIATTGFIHVALCLFAFLFLPIALPETWKEPPTDSPYLWQMGLFAVAIGVPFMAVSANAPLLQAWFARSGHAQSSEPYFLYAASNLGSLIALLGYPFIMEPVFGVSTLSSLWTVGYGALIFALAACFFIVRQVTLSQPGLDSAASAEAAAVESPTWGDRAGWVGLALVPSALLTAFTAHIATDVASAPLIWVIPLALYLLTFVVVFRERSLIPTPVILVVHLVAVILALLQLSQSEHDSWMVTATTGVIAFFSSALVAQRTLYEARPAARYLTEFYLYMSLGGVLGGLFSALVAPQLFSEVFEYPLLLALTMACRPGVLRGSLQDRLKEFAISWLILAGGFAVLFFATYLAGKQGYGFGEWGPAAATTLAAAILTLALWRWPMRQAAAALIMFAMVIVLPSEVHRGDAQRSYFGVYRVTQSSDGLFNLLNHGTTLHGAQRIRDDNGQSIADTTPATYYHPGSPMARSIDTVRSGLTAKSEKGRFGIIGLGAGSLACFSKPDETWRFFEIDPVIVSIAKSTYFTFLANCRPEPDIVLGDARLTLLKEKDQSFDLIIVDAFSSDAVPMHLMTREALELYRSKIRPGGVFVLHISNRYLDLDSVLASTLQLVPGLQGLILSDNTTDGTYAQTTSTVAVFANDEATLAPFRAMETAVEFVPGKVKPWTDDASDILAPFLSKRKG